MRRHGFAVLLAFALAACGGGGGGGGTSATPPGTGGDTTPYSSAATGSLASSTEAATITAHSITTPAGTLAYTAVAGHLDAHDPRTGAVEASMFYVAYTQPGAARTSRGAATPSPSPGRR